MKLVRSVLASVSESVPPTICLTWPSWRSMHGRKRDFLCEGGISTRGAEARSGRDAATEVDSCPRPAQPHHLPPPPSSAYFDNHIYHGRSANRACASNTRAEGCGVSNWWFMGGLCADGAIGGFWGVVLARNILFQCVSKVDFTFRDGS